jgi:hypothetical protein
MDLSRGLGDVYKRQTQHQMMYMRRVISTWQRILLRLKRRA